MKPVMLTLSLFVFTLILIPQTTTKRTANAAIDDFESWGYQLQDIDLQEIEESGYQLLVIDYSEDGTDDEEYTSEEIDKVKSGRSARKVISYISIGEAEDYRYYFQDSWENNPPEWLDGENPDWEGNYKVKYWHNEWQQIIFEYLDKIIQAGFDGAYLDIIDAYEHYQSSVTNSDDLMVEFVQNIADHTRSQNEQFMIIPQNGEELLKRQEYRQIVDAIAREEVYVIATDEKRDESETKDIETTLDLMIQDDKPVFVVDYAEDEELIEYAQENAEEKGYISFVTVVDLDQLGIDANGGFLPLSTSPLVITLCMIAIVHTTCLRKHRKH